MSAQFEDWSRFFPGQDKKRKPKDYVKRQRLTRRYFNLEAPDPCIPYVFEMNPQDTQTQRSFSNVE